MMLYSLQLLKQTKKNVVIIESRKNLTDKEFSCKLTQLKITHSSCFHA